MASEELMICVITGRNGVERITKDVGIGSSAHDFFADAWIRSWTSFSVKHRKEFNAMSLFTTRSSGTKSLAEESTTIASMSDRILEIFRTKNSPISVARAVLL